MGVDPALRKTAALLTSGAPERQIAAAIVLGEIGARDPAVVDGLIAVLAEGVPPVQRHAIEALGKLRVKKALPAVLGLVGARDEALRAAAVAAAVAFQDDAVGPVKQRLAMATEPAERRGLEEILGRVGGRNAFAALLGALDTSNVEAAKAAALAARQKIKESSARERGGYLAQVKKILATKKTRSPALTAAALKILGYLEDPAATDLLLSFAGDARQPDAVRQEALIALRFTAKGSGAARAATVLVALAERVVLPLARTALYTLASLPIPPVLARKLSAMVLGGDPDRAQLAIERLGQMPGPEAGNQLAAILTKTTDRGRAEAAAAALATRPDAARVMATALLETADEDRAVLLIKLLLPRAAELGTAGAAEKKVGRAVVQAAVARGAETGDLPQALVHLARKIDGEAAATGLRALAGKLAKVGGPGALIALRRLGHSVDASPDDGYALASAEIAAGRRDEGLTILRQLLDRGYDVPAALRRDRSLGPEARYQVGFALMEQRHPSGEEILSELAREGRSKVGRMAKAKLKSAGVG